MYYLAEGNRGNQRFLEIVADRYEEYDRRNRSNKTQLVQEVVDYVHNYGGHFLKQCEISGMWIEADNLEARNNVAHGFRRTRETRLNAPATTQTIPTSRNTNHMIDVEPVTKRRVVSVTEQR